MNENKKADHILWASYTCYKFKRQQNSSHCLLLRLVKKLWFSTCFYICCIFNPHVWVYRQGFVFLSVKMRKFKSLCRLIQFVCLHLCYCLSVFMYSKNLHKSKSGSLNSSNVNNSNSNKDISYYCIDYYCLRQKILPFLGMRSGKNKALCSLKTTNKCL